MILLSFGQLCACAVDLDTAAEPITTNPAPGGEIFFDVDSDGYARPEDCDDLDTDVHPYNGDWTNGVDDDCDDKIDEPVALLGSMRPSEEADYPQVPALRVRIADAITRDYLDNGGSLAYQLRYQRLSNASATDVVSPIELVSGLAGWNSASGIFSFDPNGRNRGFQRREVYRFTVRFFTSEGTALGEESDTFYLVTAGDSNSPSGALQWGRVDMALHALEQWSDQQEGLIGANGSVDPDGTRFTGAAFEPRHDRYNRSDNLRWCDWFYHWVGAMASDAADGIIEENVVVFGGTPFWNEEMNPDMIPNSFRDPLDDGCGHHLDGTLIQNGCQNYAPGEIELDRDDNRYHKRDPADIYYNLAESAPSAQKLGNHVSIPSHAGMFLAYDPNGDGGVGTVWTIEGNVGNRVKIVPRPANDDRLLGFGKLAAHMFRESGPPPIGGGTPLK